ncbi:MAG: hypothetical protein ACRD8O_09295 [Bryobacteraceae bacterium]
MTGAPPEPFLRLLEVFDRLEIPYMVSGSVASGMYGQVRMTGDVDFIARVREDDIEGFVAELRTEFYIDADQIRLAIRRQRSFNVIHFRSSFKFDIFPLGNDRYQQTQFGRRRYEQSQLFSSDSGDAIVFVVASPEDVILSKLHWYRLGGESSEQQWNDVLGVITIQRERLDFDYLREWAAYLKVDDLLERMLAERHEPL